MTAENNQFPDGLDDVTALLEREIGTSLDVQERDQLRQSFIQLDINKQKELARRNRRQRMRDILSSRVTLRVTGTVLAGALILGGIDLFKTYEHDQQAQKTLKQAEAVVTILKLPDAVRALDLTPEQLANAEVLNKSAAEQFGGITAVGYNDLTKLDMAASVIALAAHNANTAIDSYPDSASYTVGVDNGNSSLRLSGPDVLFVSPNVAADIAEYYRSTTAGS